MQGLKTRRLGERRAARLCALDPQPVLARGSSLEHFKLWSWRRIEQSALGRVALLVYIPMGCDSTSHGSGSRGARMNMASGSERGIGRFRVAAATCCSPSFAEPEPER
jgi:hypothetical protein